MNQGPLLPQGLACTIYNDTMFSNYGFGFLGAGEMIQRVRALAVIPEDPEFKSSHPHGG